MSASSQENKITVSDGRLCVPDTPVIPFIEGDGIGPDITNASMRVWDEGIKKAYAGKRKIVWKEIYAGEKALSKTGSALPDETLKAIKDHIVAVKGPLTTPVGGGYRSLNVAMRRALDLYACVRPVKYYKGIPSPVLHPERMKIVIFRENTEDVYAGIEWKEGTEDAGKVISYIKKEFGIDIRSDSGIGVKPISRTATKRLVKKAMQYAVLNKRKSVTLVHKGNIMKYTEGAFRDWGYEAAKEWFADKIVLEAEAEGNIPAGKIVVKDRIADSMFQQVLTRAGEYDVVALPNLNGDYLSDACAAQIGGLGIAPGANIGDFTALFEATHGTAPKYAGQDKVNPGSLILSGVMMLEYIGWKEASALIENAFQETIRQKKVTYDLHRLMNGASLLKTSQFADAVIENIGR